MAFITSFFTDAAVAEAVVQVEVDRVHVQEPVEEAAVQQCGR
jgi:hypothetical protein